MPEILDCSARDAYDVTAPVYDAFTAHHDYELWTSRLEAAARLHGLTGRRLLDVGCGTGKSFAPFLARGWDVVGCDLSPRMLERGAARAPGVPLHVADARVLPVFGAFDLVLALDDVVNYVTDPAELPGTFAGLAANLAPSGRLVFDVNTLGSYRGLFSETQVVDTDGALLLWRGAGAGDVEPGATVGADLDAFVAGDGGWWERHRAHHLQRHHPEPVLRAALAGAGLACLCVYGQGFDAVLDPCLDELHQTKHVYVTALAGPNTERR